MNRIKELFQKYREGIMYLVFGGFTTVVSFASFWACMHPLDMGTVPSNVVSWILAVAFAYVTNRLWVFSEKAHGTKGVALEIVRFALARVFTLVVETAILWLTVDKLGWNDSIMKLAATVITVVLNYVFSKLIVFRGK